MAVFFCCLGRYFGAWRWSLTELRRLFQVAKSETSRRNNVPLAPLSTERGEVSRTRRRRRRSPPSMSAASTAPIGEGSVVYCLAEGRRVYWSVYPIQFRLSRSLRLSLSPPFLLFVPSPIHPVYPPLRLIPPINFFFLPSRYVRVLGEGFRSLWRRDAVGVHWFFQKTVFCRIRANVFREMKNTLLVLPSRKEMMMVGNSSGHVKFLFPLVILLFFFFSFRSFGRLLYCWWLYCNFVGVEWGR